MALQHCRHIRIPHPEIGLKLQAILNDEGGNFEYEFNEGRSILTIGSTDLHYLGLFMVKVNLLVEEISKDLSISLSYSFTLHCAFVPLLSLELVQAIKQIASQYDASITLTGRKLSLDIAVGDVQELKHRKPLFSARDVYEITEPVCINESNESRDTSSASPNWLLTLDEHNSSILPAEESAEMEKVFQYGGINVKILGEKHIINFHEKKLISQSGVTRCFQRVPDFNAMPIQHVRLNIHGQQSIHKIVEAELYEKLEKCLVTTNDILWECPSEISPIVQQQVSNFVRQYCVLYEIRATSNNKYILTLKGSPDYVQRVNKEIKEHLEAIVQEIVPANSHLSPLLKSPRGSVPKLWEGQIDKCCILDIAPNSSDWNTVVSMMKQTKGTATLIKLERIQNPDLWEKYKLEGKQMAGRNHGEINEKFLFHGTSDMDPHKIVASEHGVDFRYSSTSKKSLMWGRGSYFAENFSYSSMYSYKVPGDGTRQLMLVSVLTGISFAFDNVQCPDLTKPPVYGPDPSRLHDTVNGKTGGSLVYVVYDHCKTCPAYILTYKDS